MISIIKFEERFRPGRDPIDMVLVAPIGEGHTKTQTWHRVPKLIPPADADENVKDSLSYKDMVAKWSIIKPAYEAWKEGREIPEDGTPLAAWAAMTPERAAALQAMGIKTIEAVRDMGDGAIQNLRFPDARKLPKLAADYLSGKDGAARDAENEELRERLAVMEEMLNEAMADKPKRGRPKKAAEPSMDEVA